MSYKTAAEIYARIDFLIEDVNRRFQASGTFQEVRDTLQRQILEEGWTAEKLYTESYIDHHLFSKHVPECYQVVPVMACAFCIDSERAEREGDLERAAKLLTQATQYCEEADANAENDYRSEARSVRASKGETARSQKYFRPAIDHLIHLLQTKRPTDGWGSAKSTAMTLAQDLIEFIDAHLPEEASTAAFDDQEGLILRWIKKDGPAYEAFSATKKSR